MEEIVHLIFFHEIQKNGKKIFLFSDNVFRIENILFKYISQNLYHFYSACPQLRAIAKLHCQFFTTFVNEMRKKILKIINNWLRIWKNKRHINQVSEKNWGAIN